jgi:hypothetical protein
VSYETGVLKPVAPEGVDRWTRHIWHVSQHGKMTIGLAGRLQKIVDEMRDAAGLPEFGWNTAFPDADFGECSVHVEGCGGQETHDEAARRLLWG